MRVDFLIIGAQKSGTTSLAAQLAGHPEVCFCRKKEPHFFSRFEDWQAHLGSYHRLFAPSKGQICGEASTSYSFLPEYRDTFLRIYEYNPGMRLIYIMRQPVERIASHYAHDLLRGRLKGPPEVEVLSNPMYLQRSRYGVQLEPYLELFGKENLLLLLFEDYIADQQQVLRQTAQFLNIDPNAFRGIEPVAENRSAGTYQVRSSAKRFLNSRLSSRVAPLLSETLKLRIKRAFFSNHLDEKPVFTPALRQMLWRFLAYDVSKVEGWMGYRLDVWRSAVPAPMELEPGSFAREDG